MKKFKFNFQRKKGQSMVEFILIAILVGIVSFWGLYKLNPQFFRSYFKGSISSVGNIDSNGQLTMQNMDDSSAVLPSTLCLPMALGAIESDGSIYAGNFGGKDLCTTPSDAGIQTWNDGSASTYTFTPVLSYTDGQTNTTQIAAFSGSGSPYKTAVYCDSLSVNGHSDWYLPSKDELVYLWANKATIGGFSPVLYWSSTSNNCHEAYSVLFDSSGSVQLLLRSTGTNRFRCVRHD